MLLALTETKKGDAGSTEGHLGSTKWYSRAKNRRLGKRKTELVLAIGDMYAGDCDDWSLDSGAISHLVSDSKLLVYSK